MYIRESHIYSGPWKQESTDNCIADNLLDDCKSPGTNLMYIFESPIGTYRAQISGIFGAYEAQITCIFAKLRDIRGDDHLHIGESPGYLQIP